MAIVIMTTITENHDTNTEHNDLLFSASLFMVLSVVKKLAKDWTRTGLFIGRTEQ